ncbi:ribonuclease R family protein [Oscillatoria salina]|uniref:ribonuclease R family protein n=1 Tax=Oscillatoria salina TaxID=331517 RepID=UPI001CCB8F8A|nr:ribonuclease R family protein [Oscillatoria salina]MBZ8181972.1 VacB/RNase II family 3'-5' exoribonuclease [Oscillatoria salina IIICB1]
MEYSIATLLSNFSDEKLVARKVLEKKLGCEDSDSMEKLHLTLDILEKIGVIIKERGKYRRVYEEDVVEAKLRCSSKGFCFAIQDSETADDVYIRESHLSNAWNGDRVLVKIIKEGSRRRSPEGEVKLILERANPSLLARVKETEDGYRAVPLDDRLLFELILRQEEERLRQAVDHLVHVEVLRYPLAQNLPLGKVTRILGTDAEEAADTDIVCCKHDLPQSFPEKVIQAAEVLSGEWSKSETKSRLDLRKRLTLTLEPNLDLDSATGQWIENAFTLEKTDRGNWELGIHITDVAYYIKPNSELDREARKRGTAINLLDKIVPLFPPGVGHCCSLIPGEDRLTLSVFLIIDRAGQVTEFDIKPSIICVDRQISYKQAQSLLGRQEDVEDELSSAVKMLNELFFNLSPVIKARRQQRGSFEIDSENIPSLYKDEGRLGAIATSSSLPVQSLLTDAIVLVNRAVGNHLTSLELPGIYCHQSEPDLEELEDLIKLGNNLHLDLQLENEEEVSPQDYQRFTQQFAKSSVRKVLNHLLKLTLKPVIYSKKPSFHFGLAYEGGYTRCVSPGQRYADLLIQRVLHALFEKGRDRRHSRTKEGVNLGSSTCHDRINWNILPTEVQDELAEQLWSVIPHLNDCEKEAHDAEKDLEGLKKAERMKECTGHIFSGLITGVQSYGFFVEIEDHLVEGLVHVSSLKDDWYEYRSRYACLVGRKNRTAYRLGDRVEVEVKSVDYYRQQIDLVTVRGGSNANFEDWEED